MKKFQKRISDEVHFQLLNDDIYTAVSFKPQKK